MLGVVVALWRYPVKSMAGEPLEAADVSWFGFAGDRRWSFVREGVPRNGFPWLTSRQRPDLLRYRPRLSGPARPNIVADAPGECEDDWARRELRIGGSGCAWTAGTTGAWW